MINLCWINLESPEVLGLSIGRKTKEQQTPKKSLGFPHELRVPCMCRHLVLLMLRPNKKVYFIAREHTRVKTT